MSRDDNDGKDRLFSFRRQKISDAEIENQSFFRSTVVLEEELNSARLATRIYLSNLKRTNSSFVLRNDFLCILDADWNGNLKETKKENFVFVKLLKSGWQMLASLSSTAKNPTKSFIERAFANVRNKNARSKNHVVEISTKARSLSLKTFLIRSLQKYEAFRWDLYESM